MESLQLSKADEQVVKNRWKLRICLPQTLTLNTTAVYFISTVIGYLQNIMAALQLKTYLFKQQWE